MMISFQESPLTHENKDDLGPNPYLVGLGIILLELSEDKSFHEWLSRRNDNILPENTINKSILGQTWLKEILSRTRMSEQYIDIILLCLTSVFYPILPSTALDNEEFREAVYHKILLPLEKEYFKTGKELEILIEQAEDDYY